MLRCSNDKNSMMDVSFTHLGLLIATVILLSVVFVFIFTNDWQRTAELQAQASSLSNLLCDTDNSFFERTNSFTFLHKEYPYSVKISTEYIVLTAAGSWQNTLKVTSRFLIRPWPRMSQQNWTTGDELHTYLNASYHHSGTQNDPISSQNFTILLQQLNNTTTCFAKEPLDILIDKPIFVEKTILYYEEKKYDFLLLYQK
jgi:hypothetical protein